MPHPAILKELNMTPQDWGRISSEEERSKLKEKAATSILSRREKSLHERMASVEHRLSNLEANTAQRIADLERTVQEKGSPQ